MKKLQIDANGNIAGCPVKWIAGEPPSGDAGMRFLAEVDFGNSRSYCVIRWLPKYNEWIMTGGGISVQKQSVLRHAIIDQEDAT